MYVLQVQHEMNVLKTVKKQSENEEKLPEEQHMLLLKILKTIESFGPRADGPPDHLAVSPMAKFCF